MTTMPPPYPGEFLRVTNGSELYGTALPGSADHDFIGVCIEDERQVISPWHRFEQHVYRTAGGQNPSQPGDIDMTVYGLRKFLSLAAHGNPTILCVFFAPPEHQHIFGPLAEELSGPVRGRVVSRDCAPRFKGYMRHQIERLEGTRGQKRTGDYRQRYFVEDPVTGEMWDAKYGMHILRLGMQGVELLTSGTMTLPMRQEDRILLGSVRQGHHPKAEVLAAAERLEAQIDGLRDTSDLPKKPDLPWLENWLIKTYREHWNQ